MDQILAIILKDTYSLGMLKHRLRILKSSLLKTFFASTSSVPESGNEVSQAATERTSEVNLTPTDLNWLQTLPASFYKQFTKDNVYQTFTAFDTAVTSLVTVTLYLTFEPDEPTISQIGFYCRKNFNNPHLLLDIKLDPALIAGTALVWKGIYKDYSLRAKIDSKKDEIAQEFRRFLR